MSAELQLWSVDDSGGVKAVSQLSKMSTELEFENILVANPVMLERDLQLIGRQTPTAGGWLDLLGVDRNGRLVVFELKSGKVSRDAVAQVLDYASALDGMSDPELAQHISHCSGEAGIQGIEDFEKWYTETHGTDDLSRLRPPRMVLIGLGVDEATERMARFVSAGGGLDLSVATFHGYTRDGEILLARQEEVSPADDSPSHSGAPAVAEKHQALRDYLKQHSYDHLFDIICGDLRERLPRPGTHEYLGKTGIRFDLNGPGGSGGFKGCFSVYAGYAARGVYIVAILKQAIAWAGKDALDQLGKSVKLDPYDDKGQARVLSLKRREEWEQARLPVLEFVDAVVKGRNKH